MEVIFLHKLPEFRHDNEKHNIPLGAIVECDIDEGFAPFHIHRPGSAEELSIGIIGKVRLYVVAHERDFDGTPMYTLAAQNISPPKDRMKHIVYQGWVQLYIDGITEHSLKVVGQSHLVSFDSILEELRDNNVRLC